MPKSEIRMSTTDSIPGERHPVTRSEVAWGAGEDTLEDARDGLEKWARENKYDAVIGLRFIVAPSVYGAMSTTKTRLSFTAYGTCVAY